MANEKTCLNCSVKGEPTDSWVFNKRFGRWFCGKGCERIYLSERSMFKRWKVSDQWREV